MARTKRLTRRESRELEREVERYASGLASGVGKVAAKVADLLGLGRRTRRIRPNATPNFDEIMNQLAAPAAPPVQPPPISDNPAGRPPLPGRRNAAPPLPPAGGGYGGREPPMPGEVNYLSEEVFTPGSSNVFSFQYDHRTSTLFVTFKASGINGKSVSRGAGRRKGGSPQLHGTLGKTVTSKRKNDRGPLYAYSNVPVRVFQRMTLAGSAGGAVWDELRVRGSIYGHRYPYRLVQGQVTPDVRGVYIPRRATREGFRTRAVANVGTGRRGFQSSTLPEQRYSTRSQRGRQ